MSSTTSELNPLKIVFYGDDFTGATDTLATAARAGLQTLLFLGLPTPTQLERAGPLDCLGIAGAARAMTAEEMQQELAPVGRLFATLGAPVLHYKTCSTFDSAVHIGSIGNAIRLLQPFAGNPFVPIVGGQPNLRRFCLFGNLFAGGGKNSAIYRLDRHPTMRDHPITPMHESDLKLHLAQQGLPHVKSIDYLAYDEGDETLSQQLENLLDQDPDAVLFDVAHSSHLEPVGRLIWRQAKQQPLLAVGPSSVVQALASCWKATSSFQEIPISPAQGPVLVLVGSLSPVTAQQVKAAVSYRPVFLDAIQLPLDAIYREQMASQIVALLQEGLHVLACTSSASSGPGAPADGSGLAQACGDLLAQVLKKTSLKRLGIAGGDTSSRAVQALDAWGLSYLAQLAPGVALCRLHSENKTLDGLEIMLKGGQMGSENIFEALLTGTDA